MARIFVWTLSMLIVLVSTLSYAAEKDTSEDNNDLKVTIAPYAWMTSINASISVRGRSADVNVSFVDLLSGSGNSNLNIAFMGHLEAVYKDTFGFLSDLNYASLGYGSSSRRADITGTTTLFMADIAPFYRFGTWNMGNAGTISLDGLAGVRVWEISMGLDRDGRRIDRTVSMVKSWVDPIIGTRAIWHFTPNWLLSLRGGVGGFGVASRFTWDTTALIGYTFWEHATVLIGYRAVGVNRESDLQGDNEFKINGTLHGPIMGVAFNF